MDHLAGHIAAAAASIQRAKSLTYMGMGTFSDDATEALDEEVFEAHFNPETGTPSTPEGQAYTSAMDAAQTALDAVWAMIPALEAAEQAMVAAENAYDNLG